MELRVNDYVRTEDGKIEKYSGTNDSEIENFTLNEIVKSSPNIIDLIEEGDYVNGYRVLNVLDFNDNSKMLSLEKIYDSKITNEDIKSIVTKEQFKNIEYEVK